MLGDGFSLHIIILIILLTDFPKKGVSQFGSMYIDYVKVYVLISVICFLFDSDYLSIVIRRTYW